MLTLEKESETEAEETYTPYEYCFNDPINSCDPSGLAPDPTQPAAPGHVSAWQVWGETLQEVTKNYPNAKNLNDQIHWYNQKTLRHELARVFAAKLDWYKSNGLIVDQPPLEPRGPGVGPDDRPDNVRRADEQLNMIANAIDHGEPITLDGAEAALINARTARDGSGFIGAMWEAIKSRGPDIVMGLAALKGGRGSGMGAPPEQTTELVERSAWDRVPVERGGVVERTWGGNLPANFKTWDKFEGGVATSMKTLDLDAPGYAKPGAIWNTGQKAVDAAIDFTSYRLQGVRIDSSMITTRVVRIAVPRQATGAQLAELNRIIQYGKINSIQVIVEKFK